MKTHVEMYITEKNIIYMMINSDQITVKYTKAKF